MMARQSRIAPFAALLVSVTASCSSSSSSTPAAQGNDAGHVVTDSGTGAEGGGPITETGVMVDYETLGPVVGLTVTDNGVSTTTDSHGAFSLTVPAGTKVLAPVVTKTSYSQLLFPDATPSGGLVDYGTNVIPDSSTYQFEQGVLGNDMTKALVQIVVHLASTCKSAVGATVTVVKPSGAAVSYFSATGLGYAPGKALTSAQDVQSPRPVAVVYNLAVGSQVTLSMAHPTCKLTPFPYAEPGHMNNGQVTTKASEPGDVNAALVVQLE